MVFAGLYPSAANEYTLLRDALDKLQLSDASLVYEPESSVALGFGFRCGFLGLLHMEIVQERLEREYGLDLLATAPSVEYQVTKTNGQEIVIDNPAELPPPQEIEQIREPWMDISVVVPDRYIGASDGAGHRQPRRVQAHGVPPAQHRPGGRLEEGRGTRRARLPHPAVGDPGRLLRRVEVAHAGLREPRLQLQRVPARSRS